MFTEELIFKRLNIIENVLLELLQGMREIDTLEGNTVAATKFTELIRRLIQFEPERPEAAEVIAEKANQVVDCRIAGIDYPLSADGI